MIDSFIHVSVTKYLNGKLNDDTAYAVFQRSFSNDGYYENEGFVMFITKAKSSTAIIVSVVVVLLVLLFFVGAVIVWRRSHRNGKFCLIIALAVITYTWAFIR